MNVVPAKGRPKWSRRRAASRSKPGQGMYGALSSTAPQVTEAPTIVPTAGAQAPVPAIARAMETAALTGTETRSVNARRFWRNERSSRPRGAVVNESSTTTNVSTRTTPAPSPPPMTCASHGAARKQTT